MLGGHVALSFGIRLTSGAEVSELVFRDVEELGETRPVTRLHSAMALLST